MPSSVPVILLAGGEGTRLRPFTTMLPKALVPLGGIPILDIIVGQLERQGFQEIIVSAGYLADMIETHVRNRRPDTGKLRLSIVRESTPLGTAGCLSMVPNLSGSFLVMNADVLTTLDFCALIDSHRASDAVLTVAAIERVTRVEWGVLETGNDDRLMVYDEKPQRSMLISMGLYVCEPDVLRYLSRDQRVDMPELIGRLLADNRRVRVHRSGDYWLDLGHPHDYARACEDFEARRSDFLPVPS
jgi:NDP-sugar pyrophosphorylase family protein